MAAETTTLFGHGQRFEPRGRAYLRPNTKIAAPAIREGVRA